jgi:hypothetical protein
MLVQEALCLSAEISFTHAGMLARVSTNRLLRMFDARSILLKRSFRVRLALMSLRVMQEEKNIKRLLSM